MTTYYRMDDGPNSHADEPPIDDADEGAGAVAWAFLALLVTAALTAILTLHAQLLPH